MKREFVMAASAVLVVAGLASCSTKKMCAGDTCAVFASGTAKISIDGRDESITGKIQCETYPDEISIMVAGQGPTRADADIKGNDVESVFIVLDAQSNFAYHGDGDVRTTKDRNTYSMAGHLEDANSAAHAFTMDVNCS